MRASHFIVARCQCAARCVRWGLLLLFGLTLFGCSAIRRQVAERRATCDSLCQQARNAKKDGYPDQADLLLNEAVRQRPDDLETRRQLAESLWDCGRSHDAIAIYEELAKLHPKDLRLHQRLATICWTAGQPADAYRSAESALRLDPTCADALLVKARCEASRREFDAATSTYIRLSRVAPDRIEARIELAEVHVERGYSNQACTVLREVLAEPMLTCEHRGDVEWKLGLAYASEDRWKEAATHLTNSIEVRPMSNVDWQMLVTAKRLAGGDLAELPVKPLTVAANLSDATPSSAWSILRDRMLVRGQILAGSGTLPQDSVIRADFQRSAQLDPHASTQ